MKKLMISVIILSFLTLCAPVSRSVDDVTWVVMYGEVKNYGLAPAFGWCSVYAQVKGWARAFVAWMPAGGPSIPEIINFYVALLNKTLMVELNYQNNDLYVEGIWDVYNVIYIFQPGTAPGNYTLDIELLMDDSHGILSVTGGWADFNVNIRDLDLIAGVVKYYKVTFGAPIRIGDVSSPDKGVPDGYVNIWDLVHTAKAYGLRPGAKYDFHLFSMDFNLDYIIDVGDLATIGANIE
ncbi:MAG: hypothetical protein QXH20_02680 [Candidatus Bathyarchaeia archaeon]